MGGDSTLETPFADYRWGNVARGGALFQFLRQVTDVVDDSVAVEGDIGCEGVEIVSVYRQVDCSGGVRVVIVGPVRRAKPSICDWLH